MSISISTTNKNEAERLVLLLIASLAVALKENVLTISDAEALLFSPYSQEKLRRAGVSKEIIGIINLGCELEDVQSIIPAKMESSIDEILSLAFEKLKDFSEVHRDEKKWID
jgi:hypothetical protein